MSKSYESDLKIGGKIYKGRVENGMRTIDGKSPAEFVEWLRHTDPESFFDLVNTGITLLRNPTLSPTKTYQEIRQKRNN